METVLLEFQQDCLSLWQAGSAVLSAVEEGRFTTAEPSGTTAEEECPRTPERQSIPQPLHPPPVIKRPREDISISKVNWEGCPRRVMRRLAFQEPGEPPTGSEPSMTVHGEAGNARKRARSAEVILCFGFQCDQQMFMFIGFAVSCWRK